MTWRNYLFPIRQEGSDTYHDVTPLAAFYEEALHFAFPIKHFGQFASAAACLGRS
jgi:hypothetical protein